MLTDIGLDRKGNRIWKVTVPPVVEPVSVEELKTFAKIDGSGEDNLLASFIESARQKLEEYLGRAFIEQTMVMFMDWWVEKEVYLPRPSLISVTSVETLDESNVATVYAASNYFVITESIPGKIVIKSGISMPTNTVRNTAGFKITYKAGYGTTPNQVPRQIRNSILQLATLRFEKRISDEEIPAEVTKELRHMRVRFNG
jgi:uncharacterized phiE125 gp8 family phage protein